MPKIGYKLEGWDFQINEKLNPSWGARPREVGANGAQTKISPRAIQKTFCRDHGHQKLSTPQKGMVSGCFAAGFIKVYKPFQF
jgi:hypothetical protein